MNEEKQEQYEDAEPEQFDESGPELKPEDPEYVERPKSQRVLAWILVVLVIIGVILYYLWIAGILHE